MTLPTYSRTPRISIRGETADFDSISAAAIRSQRPIMEAVGTCLRAAAEAGLPKSAVRNQRRVSTRQGFFVASPHETAAIKSWREAEGLTWPEAVHLAASMARIATKPQ